MFLIILVKSTTRVLYWHDIINEKAWFLLFCVHVNAEGIQYGSNLINQ